MYFPLFLDLSDKHIVVVGGGKIARRRILSLADFVGHLTVIAPEVDAEILALKQEPHITIITRTYQPEDLRLADVVLAATNDPVVNTEIGNACKRKHIPVNVAHDQSLNDFFFPALIRKENLVVGVTSSGTDHALVKETAAKIRRLLSENEEDRIL